MSLPVNQVLQGDCLEVMRGFPSESIDLVLTSPPYWGLRDYGLEAVSVWGGDANCEHEWIEDNSSFGNMGGGPRGRKEVTPNYRDNLSERNFCVKCDAWRGQLGLEPHPSMFIEHLVLVFREVKRVLKKSGSLYLNLGDTYFGGKGQSGRKDHNLEQRRAEGRTLQKREYTLMKQDAPQDLCRQDRKWLQPKQLMLIPSRVAIALQTDGWILRNDIVWHKSNHMPSSVRDRLTNSWEHLFHFVKARRYFYDLDAIRKPHKQSSISRDKYGYKEAFLGRYTVPWEKRNHLEAKEGVLNPKGKNPADVYQGKFDGYGEESEKFGSPRARTQRKHNLQPAFRGNNFGVSIPPEAGHPLGKNPSDFWSINTKPFPAAHFATFPPALCEMPIKAACPKDGVVLDPFCGAGTTLVTAHKLSRRWIGIDIVPSYVKMAKARLKRECSQKLAKFSEAEEA